MSAESDFYAAVTGSPQVTAAVAARVYPDIAPEGVGVPLIVYERRATAPTQTIHDGAPVAASVTLAVSSWATSRIAAEHVADLIVQAAHVVARVTNRFVAYNADKALFASVIEFEVWELS